MTSDSGIPNDPNTWDNTDAAEAYHFDQDSDSSNSIENVNTYTDTTMNPGEIWAFKVRLTVSSEPTSGPLFIEIRDDGGNNILARSVIGDYGGYETVLQATLPAYEVNGGYDAPADSSASPEIRFNNVAGDTVNYFVETYMVRLRDEIDLLNEVEADGFSLNSGQL